MSERDKISSEYLKKTDQFLMKFLSKNNENPSISVLMKDTIVSDILSNF